MKGKMRVSLQIVKFAALHRSQGAAAGGMACPPQL